MALQLAPRENMALTLADSFLNDLDELEEDTSKEQAKASKPKKKDEDEEEDDDEIANDLDELDEMDEDEDDDDDEGLETAAGGGIAAGAGLDTIAKLRKSDRYARHLRLINEYSEKEALPGSIGVSSDDKEYQLIVESNEVLVKIDAEINTVHRYVSDVYSKKFPELETLIPAKLDYMRVVQKMGNEMDMTQLDLSEILPPTVVMVVSVTGSTTSGQPLTEAELVECLKGCDEALGLDADKLKILRYLESRMSVLAPNLTGVVGSSLAAMLVGMAGGLEKLANIPACNLSVMGQEKRNLAGFGNVAGMPHTGVLYFSDLVQSTPPPLRRKVLKIVASKASLAVRIDAYNNTGDESADQADLFREEIKAKIEKLCEPPQAQKVKALPPPDIMSGKKKRGGRRVRNAKDKLRQTEMRSAINKRSFAHHLGTEYGDDSMGLDFGMMGKEGGKLRAPTKTEKKQTTLSQKRRKMIQVSAGAVNGLSSSLVFTPVQGIELANPNAQSQAAVDAANDKWFAKSSGFQSALPQSKPGLFG